MKKLLMFFNIIGSRPLGLITETYSFKQEANPKNDNISHTIMPTKTGSFQNWYDAAGKSFFWN